MGVQKLFENVKGSILYLYFSGANPLIAEERGHEVLVSWEKKNLLYIMD